HGRGRQPESPSGLARHNAVPPSPSRLEPARSSLLWPVRAPGPIGIFPDWWWTIVPVVQSCAPWRPSRAVRPIRPAPRERRSVEGEGGTGQGPELLGHAPGAGLEKGRRGKTDGVAADEHVGDAADAALEGLFVGRGPMQVAVDAEGHPVLLHQLAEAGGTLAGGDGGMMEHDDGRVPARLAGALQ